VIDTIRRTYHRIRDDGHHPYRLKVGQPVLVRLKEEVGVRPQDVLLGYMGMEVVPLPTEQAVFSVLYAPRPKAWEGHWSMDPVFGHEVVVDL
jgi:hypothetical protein